MRAIFFRIIMLGALGAADYWIGRPWRFVFWVLTIAFVAQWVSLHHRRETILIIRRRRHRLANQLQLITGWLQLGAYAKAEESVLELIDQEAQQSLWFRGMPSYWTYFFLYWDAVAESRGIQITWLALDQFEPRWGMGWMLQRVLRQAIRIAEDRVAVHLGRGTFTVQVPGAVRPRAAGWRRRDDGVEYVWQQRQRT